jgi:selenocysteine lyase/cysteine desulfurase
MSNQHNIYGRRKFLKGVLGSFAAAAIPVTAGKRFPAKLYDQFTYQSGEDFWQSVRKKFPLTQNRIYMNTSTIGPSPYPVIEAINEKMIELETISETGHSLLRGVRRKAANLFNCDTDEIAFTRNTTEGMNIIARGLPLKDGDEILMSTHEHPGGAQPWLALANDINVKIKLFTPGKTDEENLDIIESNITRKTRVLSISHILLTTGLIFPSAEIAKLCRDKDIFYILDGAHGPGMIPIDFHELGCDFYAASGHKWLLGPKGTGLLFIRDEMFDVWNPRFAGAYADSRYNLSRKQLVLKKTADVVEYGTRSTELIAGLGAAFDFITEIGTDRFFSRGREISAYIRNELQKVDGIEVLTPNGVNYNGSFATFRFAGRGSNSRSINSSLNREYKFRTRMIHEAGLNAIRLTPHVYNSFEEAEKLVDAVKELM